MFLAEVDDRQQKVECVEERVEGRGLVRFQGAGALGRVGECADQQE
jgi:hypothetical protein